MSALLSRRQIEKISVESFRTEKIMKNKAHFKVDQEFLKFKFCDCGTFISPPNRKNIFGIVFY